MLATPGNSVKRVNPDGSPFCLVHAMQQLKDHWHRAAQASPHLTHYAQISSMCDEYHCALTASPSMPITTTNHDDYEAYDDNKESIDVPSELNDLTNPSPTSLRKTELAQIVAVCLTRCAMCKALDRSVVPRLLGSTSTRSMSTSRLTTASSTA